MLDKLPPKPECAKPWRDVLPVHAAADLFPLLSKGELEELSRDIKENGLRQRCHTIDENGRTVLLDGRNRLDALEHIGEKITLDNSGIFEQLPADVDPYAFVISANIHRRHLTREETRDLIGKLLKATPEKSNRQIAETAKASHVTVGAVRAEMESTGQIDQLIKTVGKDGKARRPRGDRGDAEQIRAEKAAPVAAPESRSLPCTSGLLKGRPRPSRKSQSARWVERKSSNNSAQPARWRLTLESSPKPTAPRLTAKSWLPPKKLRSRGKPFAGN